MVRVQRPVRALQTVLLLSLLNSCAQWLLPPLKVLSCSLEEGGAFLRFSASPQEESILKAFSMTEDGTRLEGRFSFKGEEIRFYPVNGIRGGRVYKISLSVTAEDRQGNSLEEDYYCEFFTKGETGAPSVTEILPADGSVLAEAPKEILIRFSEPVDSVSFEEALRISPSPDYVIQWDPDCREALIRPVKPLSLGTRYTISISTALLDRSRNGMVIPFTSSFFLGNDRSAPELSLEWVNASGQGPLTGGGGPNVNLPLDAEFDISFTRNVEIESLGAYIEIRPSLGISVKAERDSRVRARLSFTRNPAWGESYTLIVRKGIGTEGGWATGEDQSFLLVFDDPRFMPPRFLRGFLDIRTEKKILSEETDFDSLNLDPAIFKPVTGGTEATELCMVFAVSQEAGSLAPSSAMDAFSISAGNGCAYISIKKLRVLDEVSYRASPFNDSGLEAGTGRKLCALVYGLEIENTQQRGLIVFSMRSSLKDLLGNSPENSITITWNKE
jgi:hypothetical protein